MRRQSRPLRTAVLWAPALIMQSLLSESVFVPGMLAPGNELPRPRLLSVPFLTVKLARLAPASKKPHPAPWKLTKPTGRNEVRFPQRSQVPGIPTHFLWDFPGGEPVLAQRGKDDCRFQGFRFDTPFHNVHILQKYQPCGFTSLLCWKMFHPTHP